MISVTWADRHDESSLLSSVVFFVVENESAPRIVIKHIFIYWFIAT